MSELKLGRGCAFACEMTDIAAFDQLLAVPLRGEIATWDESIHGAVLPETAARRVTFHGIAGLLQDRTTLLLDWPEDLRRYIREQARAQAFWELRHKELIAEVIEAFDATQVRSVVLKGTAIAYSLYDNPSARARGDTDLLISELDLPIAMTVLEDLGWVSVSATHGKFGDVQQQDLWQFHDASGFSHDIDLHWQLTNSVALKNVLTVEEVFDKSVALERLSLHSKAPDPSSAFIHGLINGARHKVTGYFSVDRLEYGPGRLIWAYDLKLQTSSLTEKEWHELANLSQERGVAKICSMALEFAQERVGVNIPKHILRQLTKASHDTAETRYLTSRSGAERGLKDLRATPGIKNKIFLLLARAFPKPDLLKIKYPNHGNWPLPLLYSKRIIEALVGPSRRS